MKRLLIIFTLGVIMQPISIKAEKSKSLPVPHNPFSYDLGVKIIPGNNEHAGITICCHGYGHSNQIVDIIDHYKVFDGPLLGFNFPDHGITPQADHRMSAYGSVDEILPLLYLLNYSVTELAMPTINLYGFSAGGGAVVNALHILHHFLYEDRLQALGITSDAVKKIIDALARGYVILDCPLKSLNELLASRDNEPELEIVAAQYAKNNMNPIDVLPRLRGINLNIILHFQKIDKTLGNRDDALYMERLTQANNGKTTIIVSDDGGHNTYHAGLWDSFRNMMKNHSLY